MKKITKLLLLLVLMVMGTASAWADDYEASVTVNGTTTSYTTFEAAFDAAESASPATITLLKDCNSSVDELSSSCDITISGGTHTLTMSKYVNVEGKLTITDGTFTTSSDWNNIYSSQMFYVNANNASMTVNGGNFTTTNCDTPIRTNNGTLTVNAGTFYGKDRGVIVGSTPATINSGTFYGGNGSIYAANGINSILAEGKGYYNTDCKIATIDFSDVKRINQDVIVSAAEASLVTAATNSTTATIAYYNYFSDALYAAKNKGAATTVTLLKDCESVMPAVDSFEDITISGGKYTLTIKNFYGVIAGKLTIQDGTFTTSESWDGTQQSQMFLVGNGTMTVNGGTFTTTKCPTPIRANYGTLTINGGTFYGEDRGVIVGSTSAALNGGTFGGKNGGGIYAANGVTSILGTGKGYFNADGTKVTLDLTDANRINQNIMISAAEAYVSVTTTENEKDVTKTTCYPTFDEAFVAAKNATSTITLLKSCGTTASSLDVNEGNNITISGGKYALTSSVSTNIKEGGSLTIIDGTFNKAYVVNGGTMIVNGGTFNTADNNAITATKGTLTINGGSFTGAKDGVYVGKDATATLNGGTYYRGSDYRSIYAYNGVASVLGAGKMYFVNSDNKWSPVIYPTETTVAQNCKVDDTPAELHISNDTELYDFSRSVNSGFDYSGTTVYLDNDINISTYSFPNTNHTPIGTLEHPYIGTFDGQGHSIHSMCVNITSDYAGFFGCVAGENTVIKNTIIARYCYVKSTASAVGGLVGGVNPTNSGKESCKVTIENCGNEGNVWSGADAGGIIGGVYAKDAAVLVVTNCYNTGDIHCTGTGNQAAAICGYARMNYTFTNCYNSGTITGGTDDQHFYRPKSGGTTSVKNCYDTGGYQVVNITATQIASGELCFLLNGSKAAGVWGQTSTDAYPVLSGAGMQHYSRTMTNKWGTICLPFAVEPGSDYDFYKLSEVTSDALTLKKIEGTLAAGMPAIVRRSGDATGINLNASNTTFVEEPITGSDDNGLTLTGKFTKEQITDEAGYIIANNAFWKIKDIQGTNSVYCLPFHAYLAGDLLLGAKMLNIGIGDDVTGIYNLDADVNADANLNGKFLINGKLVIIKDGKEYNAAGQQVR